MEHDDDTTLQTARPIQRVQSRNSSRELLSKFNDFKLFYM